MHQINPQLRKRLIFGLVGIFVGLFLFFFVTRGVVTINSQDGYGVSFYRIDGDNQEIKTLSAGFHFIPSGKYVVVYTNQKSSYSYRISVKRFFQVTSSTLKTSQSSSARHVLASNEDYLYELGGVPYTYSYKGQSLLSQSYNDPTGSQNKRVHYLEGDGACEIIGTFDGSLMCVSGGAEYGGYSALYPLNISAARLDSSKPIRFQSPGTLYKIDRDKIITAKDRDVNIYSKLGAEPKRVKTTNNISANGNDALASIGSGILFSVSGRNFSDTIGDSDQTEVVRANYVFQKTQLETGATSTIKLDNSPLISGIDANENGSFIVLKTLTGFRVVNPNGAVEFEYMNDTVSDIFWLDDTTLVYSSVSGIYKLSTSSWATSPLFSHENISIAYASKLGSDKIFFSGFYKNQESQEPQGFVIDPSLDAKYANTFNELYESLPYEQLEYVITPDQETIYIQPRTVQGSGGFSNDDDSAMIVGIAKDQLSRLLPEPLSQLELRVIQQ